MRVRILKTVAFIMAVGAIESAYAVDPGFYMGLMLGPATNDASSRIVPTQSGTPPTVIANPKSTQFGTRIFMGNKMNKYIALEGGASYYSNINYDTANDIPPCGGTTARVRAIDFVGKGSYDFGYGFDVFGKAGAAVVYSTTSGGLNSSSTVCGKTTYSNKVSPTFSAGASYDLNQNWVSDVSWSRLMVGGHISNVDFFALGFSYHFVNKYCGQFLCDD